MSSLSEFVRVLGIQADRAQVVPSGGGRLDFHFEIYPDQFLEQAAVDLKAGGGSALFNSITNSRRAILCQVDRLLQALGFQIRHLSTKQKTELLKFIGLPAPNILKKVGDTRNLLEHEYKIPPQDKVEDAYDIALLFIESTERYLDTFWGEYYMGNNDDMVDGDIFHHYNNLSFDFEEDSKRFLVRAERYSSPDIYKDRTIIGEALVSQSDPLFVHCVRLALTEISSVSVSSAISDFFQAIKAQQGAAANS